MITFGTTSLFTSESSLGERAPGAGAAIGRYIKLWELPLQEAYADLSIVGERALFISLAAGGRSAHWLVALNGDETSAEAAALHARSVGINAPQTILAPIVFAVSYWVGPEPVPAYNVGAEFPPLPEELWRLAGMLAPDGSVSIDVLMDAYWLGLEGRNARPSLRKPWWKLW